MKKKTLLSMLLAGAMTLSLAACGGGGTTPSAAPTEPPAESAAASAEAAPVSYEPATVRVAYMPNLGSAASLFTAIEQGYFEDVGITVEPYEFQGGPAEIAAMGSGDIDVAQIGHGAHKLCIQGQALIFEMDQTSLAEAVVGNKSKGVNTAADLKGKTVAMSTGTSAEIILKLVLEDAGLTMDDIKPVEMDANGIVTAMVSGQVDACATWSPGTITVKNALKDDYNLLGDNSDFLDRASFPASFITSQAYADANSDVLVRFTAAIERAKVYRAANIDEVAKLLAVKLELPEDTLLQSTAEGDWQGAVDCEGDIDTIKTYYKAQQKVFLDSGLVETAVPVEDYILFDVMKDGNALAATQK